MIRNFVRTAFVAAMLLNCASVVKAQVSIGIRIGPPPPPRVVHVVPVRPGPDFLWVEGYWYPVGGHYRWHDGYWTRPPYAGARWIAPHHDGRQFYEGYWEGNHGRLEHDHTWDHDRDRDYHDHGHGN
jgi:WXXGXW repeat (2 copies)